MEKKKRSKCETSHRKVFTVNTKNPKEEVIYNFLFGKYNEAETIKDILYNYIIGNNLQTCTHSVNNVQTMYNIRIEDSTNYDKQCVNDNAKHYTNSEQQEEIINNDFNINLENFEDKKIEVNIKSDDSVKQANNNALDFLKNF
ncbi:hypothetical protein NE172_02210 [Clostridium botulinum]|uniref:Uncharacterized protein n=1 Tax=Clostridium botulinum TaxID=1491 RepID=A0A6B4JHJ9_CLOBO|nr:hypothetical protein [Clostridium botulinum]EES48141.1 conserved hypothetical protein [Clostridium botulinum E1 str. 'BoNT E Beluga']MBY6759759.1 hypothetical protein [Clostridium botulinum]MBY6918668.1 hypothetical protein [Clostridium botulinum]MCR1129754.1 hypothetical protein [Clostridium botulinum]NFJ56474.1 hypothetical protein [Clostridium botulinum]